MNIIKLSIGLFVLLNTAILIGQTTKEIPLYPNGIQNNPINFSREETYVDSSVNPKSLSQLNRVYSYISNPTYLIYPASETNNQNIGVVIYPGGGLVNNWLDKEGTDLAMWLSGKGITCMVVKYRTNQKDNNGKFIIPFDEYRAAVNLDTKTSILKLKEQSNSLRIDKEKIGIIGFSAGGWLSEGIAFESAEGIFEWEPAFVGLIYHGDNVEAIKQIKNKSDLPPFFMAVARDDKKLPMKTIIPFLSTIVSEVDKSELHIYSKGNHGFGLAYNNGYSVELWKDSFYKWLLDIYNK